MKFTFTEKEHDAPRKFGGVLEITSESASETDQLIHHFKLFKDTSDIKQLKARIVALESGVVSHVIGTDKRPAYEVDSCLDYEFTAPYKAWALECFGYDGIFPDLEIPLVWHGLKYTNYQARIYTQSEHICFHAFTTSDPWGGMDAQTYAEKRVADCIAEEFGTRYSEPEFLPTRHGQYIKNPDYLKRHRATPMASNARLKRTFFSWWLENHANGAQKAIVAGNQGIASKHPYMSAFEFERHESTIYHEHTGNDYKAMSFSDFAKLT